VRALVTGGAGFIGSYLVEELINRGHSVIALDDLSTGAIDNIAHLIGNDQFSLVAGSVTDEQLVGDISADVDTIFHLAAAVGVRTILDNPLGGLQTNLRGTELVLESALRAQARILITSTSEVYGLNTSDSLAEESRRVLGSPLVSRWSYAEAKALDETLAYLYWRDYKLPTVIVRPFNIVGPRQTGRYGMVIPRFVRQALTGSPVTVYGSGEQRRCFCHVRDAVAAFVDLMGQPGAYGKVFNIGRAEEISVGALAQRVISLTGSSSSIERLPYSVVYPEGFEDMERRVPDVSRIRDLIAFDPKHTLDDILLDVIDHERAALAQLATAGLA
jgi:UDP-glucose 4-epimerase